MELEGGLKAGRLDKVAMLGLKPDEIEVLSLRPIDPGATTAGCAPPSPSITVSKLSRLEASFDWSFCPLA